MPTASNQGTPKPPLLSTIKLPTPCLSLSLCQNSGKGSCQSKLWINSFFLFLFRWSSFISTELIYLILTSDSSHQGSLENPITDPCSSKCGPQHNSSSSTWEPVWFAESQSLPQTYCFRTCIFNQILEVTLQHIKAWRALTRNIDPGQWVSALGAH